MTADHHAPAEVLKPCPFCGAVTMLRENPEFPDDRWEAECPDNCVTRTARTLDELVAWWNRRAPGGNLATLRALVSRQAEDAGLWFVGDSRTAPEGYLQQELRKLHAAVEALPSPREVDGPPVLAAVLAELERATRKFPTWPTDPLHAVAVLGEEAGELVKAVLQAVYEPHKSTADDVREEAIQTAAMALRFAMSLGSYAYQRGAQHEQAALAPQGGTRGE